MRRFSPIPRRRNLLLVTVALLSPFISLEASAAAAARGPGPGPWKIQTTPSPGTFDRLFGTAAIDPEDVWSVGRFVDGANVSRPLIEHWNGMSWVTTASNVPVRRDGDLLGVTATPDARDVWAVGYTTDLVGTDDETLVDHWNGKRWNVATPANPGVLAGVAARSQTDVWAVGDTGGDNGVAQTLAEHWDGTAWSVVPTPEGQFGGGLEAATAVSSTDVWAAGSVGTSKFNSAALIEHWNGSQWQVVPTPPIGQESDLRAIAAVSASDVWAVGNYDLAFNLIEHWDGVQWSIVPGPDPTNDDILQGVTAPSTTDVWAVGSEGGEKDLIEHWNGSAWAIVPSPHRHDALNSLAAASVDVKGGLWAAGFDLGLRNYGYHTLVLHAHQ
jgi:hypothetical protein